MAAVITTSMNFLKRDELYQEEKPYLLIYEPPEGFPKTNIRLEKCHNLQLRDIRGSEDQLSLERHGFQLRKIPSKMTYEDFEDDEVVKRVYLQEAADEVRKVFGAIRVQIFEHLLRRRHQTYPISTGEPYVFNQPTSVAHVDTTPEWVSQMVQRLNPETYEDLLKQRVLCVNVWKPLRGPVRDWPLALCDVSTVEMQDAHPGDLVYDDYVVENCQLHFAEGQKWYYVSDQQAEEAWIFIQSDSETSSIRAGVPHSSFPLPQKEKPLFPRESIEIRCIVYV